MANVNVNCTAPNGLVIEVAGQRVTLNGSDTNWAGAANPWGAPGSVPTSPAPGVTSVDSTFINAWLTANAGQPLVTGGVVALAS